LFYLANRSYSSLVVTSGATGQRFSKVEVRSF
jgi:hypothetical protein